MQLSDKYLSDFFPFYRALTDTQKELMQQTIQSRTLSKGELIYHADSDWRGLKMIAEGQIRVFLSTEQGNNVTLYRVRKGDVCIISLICLMDSRFSASLGVAAEADTEVLNVPEDVYKKLLEENPEVRNMNDSVSHRRFGEILSVISDLLFSNMEHRLSKALISYSELYPKGCLLVTHEQLANDIGTAREVVTRNLKRFQNLGYLKLERGRILLSDISELKKL